MLHPPQAVATPLKNQGEAKLSWTFIGREKTPQLFVSDRLTKGVFKYSDSEIKHSSSVPLTTEQVFPFLLVLDPCALTSLHCTLPVFPLHILADFCFSLKLPGQNYWVGSITILSYREKKHSTEPFYVMKWTQSLVVKGENQHLPEEFRLEPSWRSEGSGGALSARLSDTGRLTCWLAGAGGGFLFLHNVIPLSPVPPAPGATCAALPLLWQEHC